MNQPRNLTKQKAPTPSMQLQKQSQLVKNYYCGDDDLIATAGNIRNSLLNMGLISQRLQRREQETKELLQIRLERFFASLPTNQRPSLLPRPLRPREPRKAMVEPTHSSLQMASQRALPPTGRDDTTDVSVTTMSTNSDATTKTSTAEISDVTAVTPMPLPHAKLTQTKQPPQPQMSTPLKPLPRTFTPVLRRSLRHAHTAQPMHVPRLKHLPLPMDTPQPPLPPQQPSGSRSILLTRPSQQRRSRSASQQHLAGVHQRHLPQQRTLAHVRGSSLSTQQIRPEPQLERQSMTCAKPYNSLRPLLRHAMETQSAPTPVPKPRTSRHTSTSVANSSDSHPVCQIFRVTDVDGIKASIITREDRRLFKILGQYNCQVKIMGTVKLANRETVIVYITGPNGRHLNWCVDRIQDLFPAWELKSQMRKALRECE